MSDEKGPFRTPAPGMTPSLADKVRELQEIESRIQLRTGLPFLYGWKWYSWARKFYESTNKQNFLCAANQISKSSTQIRKCINWATDQKVWPSLWNNTPTQFWYLYPSQKVINAEFETKWKQFLPNGEYKDDPYYGWKVEQKKGDILAIHFNSGIHVYFKTYAQQASNLQTGTCDAIFCDEELPMAIYNELLMRLSASDGYFHMVFTATLGQEFWRKTMEPEEDEEENLPNAFKQTISLYDAMFYEDGTQSHWTIERIKQIEARCSTASEVLKRVYGRFIVIGGRIYESFDIKRHMKPKHPLPKNWHIYAAADHGSGGEENDGTDGKKKSTAHPAALVYVAVAPDFRSGRVFLGRRFDGVVTTPGDVVQQHLDFKRDHKLQIVQQWYDWASKDFFNVATRMNEHFEKAEKGHEVGEGILNTLFKHDMLFIYDDPELGKLGGELASLKKTTAKRNAKDDFADALRYCVAKIPWDFTFITGEESVLRQDKEPALNAREQQIADRRAAFDDAQADEEARINEEFEEWNDFGG